MVARDRGYMVREEGAKKSLPLQRTVLFVIVRHRRRRNWQEVWQSYFPFISISFFFSLLSLCYKYVCARGGCDGIFSPFSGVRRETKEHLGKWNAPDTRGNTWLEGGKGTPPKNRKWPVCNHYHEERKKKRSNFSPPPPTGDLKGHTW